MMLYDAAIDRLGPGAIRTSSRVTGYDHVDGGVVVHVDDGAGRTRVERGRVLIGADGIHSAIRAQMYPDEGPPLWSGKVLWRGTTRARPYLDGRTMVFCGHDSSKVVSYPISSADPESGEATINWIAVRTFDPSQYVDPADYSSGRTARARRSSTLERSVAPCSIAVCQSRHSRPTRPTCARRPRR